MSIWVIGDIHGQASLLARLLANLPRQAEDTTVFLGDYIDRGPDSAGVVRRVLAELDRGSIALWGNHEDMAAAAYGLASPGKMDTAFAGALWLFPPNGGPDTLASLGSTFPGECPPALRELFPRLRTYWVDPESGIEFVHACAPAGKSLAEIAAQEPAMDTEPEGAARLLWETPGQRERADSGRLVIVGHTSLDTGVPERRSHHVLIDTNAAHDGPLTALRITEQQASASPTLEAYQAFPNGSFRTLRETPNGAGKRWEV